MEWKDILTKPVLVDTVTIKYNSKSKAELVAIEDMHPTHLVNAIYKTVKDGNHLCSSFIAEKKQVEEVVWNL